MHANADAAANIVLITNLKTNLIKQSVVNYLKNIYNSRALFGKLRSNTVQINRVKRCFTIANHYPVPECYSFSFI